MQWEPFLPKEGGLIQVDIVFHPPIPHIPPFGFITFLVYSIIYYF